MKETILYIDAFNLFYRNYSSHPSTDENGEPNGGVIGFISQLRNYIDKFSPQYTIIVFDGDNAGYRRRNIYENYKGKKARKKRFSYLKFDEDFIEKVDNEELQIKQIYEILKYLPCIILQISYYEADDIISYLVNGNKKFNHIVVSTDQDYIQLVEENIYVYSPTKKILFDTETVSKYYNIHHKNFLYSRLISGDVSDKITGIDGVALKSLIKIFPELKDKPISNYEEFENLIINKENFKKNKKIDNLKNNIEIIRRNYKLCQLEYDNISLSSKKEISQQLLKENEKTFSIIKTKIFFIKKYLNFHFKNFEIWIKPFTFIKNKITLENVES